MRMRRERREGLKVGPGREPRGGEERGGKEGGERGGMQERGGKGRRGGGCRYRRKRGDVQGRWRERWKKRRWEEWTRVSCLRERRLPAVVPYLHTFQPSRLSVLALWISPQYHSPSTPSLPLVSPTPSPTLSLPCPSRLPRDPAHGHRRGPVPAPRRQLSQHEPCAGVARPHAARLPHALVQVDGGAVRGARGQILHWTQCFILLCLFTLYSVRLT